MAQGLLGGVLPAIYSGADQLKRGVYGLLTNPMEQAERAAQSLLQSRAERQALMARTFANPERPFQVTDQAGLAQLGDQIMAGELGFAPAGIVSPVVAKAINMPVSLPTDEVFQKAVANTPNAQITDEGLLLNVMRKQKPEQSMTESVRGGVFYLPEGASQMKHYGGTGYYGGTEKIAGETLYKNPLFVKGATGGKAPEAAYEQLVGKDGLKAMQDDVQRIISGYNSGEMRTVVDGIATESPVASRIMRLGGDPEKFIQEMQPKLNAQKQALEKASKEEVLPDITEYDLAKMDLDATLKLIDEAKSYVGKKISNRNATIIDVENFLDKYVPDLSGYGNYIIDNSKQGNQLKYALQEAAVAQKVRDSGFDSVIGHSKKKGEPTISEIFDVRESHYPNAYGDFQLMPKFEGLLD
jgi:hypothetical protein